MSRAVAKKGKKEYDNSKKDPAPERKGGGQA